MIPDNQVNKPDASHSANLDAVLRSYLFRGHAPKFRGRLHRRSIAEALGCSQSSLSRNSLLRPKIERFERDHLQHLSDSYDIEPECIASEGHTNGNVQMAENVILLRRTVTSGKIVFSKVVYKEVTYRVPALIWPSGIDQSVSDWLRYLSIKLVLSEGTVEEAAKILRSLTNFREEHGVAWDRVDDELLRLWMARMQALELSPKRINKCLGLVHAFYRWAEETGRLANHVEVIDRHNLPDEMKSYKFPISSRRVYTKKSHGRIISSWRTTVFATGERSSHGARNTPNNDQVEAIFDVAIDDPVHGTRNSLLMSWALDTGGRVHEILQVRLSHLPQSIDDIRRMRELDFWPIEIKRKGEKGNRGVLRPSADLVLRTLAYISTERAMLADKTRGRRKGECKFVFLSEKGRVLDTDSATRICGKIFRAAGVKKANIQRLRAKFAQRMVEAALEALEEAGIAVGGTSNWHETALTMAQEMMGHSSIMSLRPYLQALLKRRVDLAPTYQQHKADGSQRERRLLERQQAKSLEGNAELARIGVLIRSGQDQEAAMRLKALARQLGSGLR
jgi:site-specific recombinase XerD